MNTAILSCNAPISEFIDMLREWLIAGNADPRVIYKIDELQDCALAPEKYEEYSMQQHIKHYETMEKLQNERNHIAEELRALYDAVQENTITADVVFAAGNCIERNKIT